MADRYWVGGTDNWDTNVGTKWASISGGSGGQNVPTSADDVYFDGNSSTGICTITATATAKSLNCTGYGGTITGTSGLTVSGNVTLVSGMTWSYTGTLTSNATATITSAGQTFGAVTKSTAGTTLTFADNFTSTGALSWTGGTIDLTDKEIIFLSVDANNTGAKTLTFGTTGVFKLSGTGTVWSQAFGANSITSSGSRNVTITSTGNTTISVATGAATTATCLNFNLIAGTYTAQLQGQFRDITTTGFGGTLSQNNTRSIFGNLTLSSGTSVGSSTQANTFNSTGTQTIQTFGKTLDFPIIRNGVGGTLQLLDTLTQGTTRSFTHTNGTLDLNGQTLIVGTYATAAGTKNITFNAGILRVAGGGTTAFNNAVNTGFSTTAGTGSGEIQMTNSGTKTFAGNNATYSCTLAHNNTGALTLSGNNTFTSISNTSGARTFTFTINTTTTVTNWLATGNAGNVVTVNSSTAGTQHFLSKSGGGTVSVDYMSIQDSNASPSTSTWYAGTNSTSVSNNFGWIFTAPPTPGASTSNFLFLWTP